MNEYKVIRPHFGDKDYKPGEIRQAKPNEVHHLVKNGVLMEVTEESKPKPKTTKTQAKQAKPE
ncbi:MULTISPECIES: hypothetical protein [unclassified Acinetobacter]|uniref:hypothetical protein n=1 Tax=unclassified Acinetobacter TaxID=196816 RepID=UPI0015D196B2|nr:MULTISPECIES: hypothetical protein [unclassified Acinetobacter]